MNEGEKQFANLCNDTMFLYRDVVGSRVKE